MNWSETMTEGIVRIVWLVCAISWWYYLPEARNPLWIATVLVFVCIATLWAIEEKSTLPWPLDKVGQR